MVTRLTQHGPSHPHTVQDRGGQPLSLPLPLTRRHPAAPAPPMSMPGGLSPLVTYFSIALIAVRNTSAPRFFEPIRPAKPWLIS